MAMRSESSTILGPVLLTRTVAVYAGICINDASLLVARESLSSCRVGFLGWREPNWETENASQLQSTRSRLGHGPNARLPPTLDQLTLVHLNEAVMNL